MPRDTDRANRVSDALRRASLDALVCALPTNVRMLSGYWPVVGTSLAVFTRDGYVSLIVPEDEKELAERGWADDVRTFKTDFLDHMTSSRRTVVAPLGEVLRALSLKRLGYEGGPAYIQASYSAMHLYGGVMADVLREAAPRVEVDNAAELLARLRARLSPPELATLRAACSIAERAFVESSRALRPGMRETEVAALFRAPLETYGTGFHVERAGGFCWCMSGPNSAEASAAYARSRARQVGPGDLVLVHCNSYADGLWTDVTRTYWLPVTNDDSAGKVYRAILDARAAALDAVRSGATGADVDRAARDTLRRHGFTKEFRHPTGHGTGLAAIAHTALPRIHPASDDVLETGMVFNIEPAVYIDGWGGIRHCDMVAVTERGAEVLTHFQDNFESLVIAA